MKYIKRNGEVIKMMRIYITMTLGLLLFSFGCKSKDQPQPGEYYVDIYDPEKTCEGTTLFTDGHDANNLKVVEVDMQGDIVWEFTLPQGWAQWPIVGFEAELLSNGNILIVLSRTGLFEIDRNGNTVWQHLDPDCSHDADRLPGGNTIYVFGNEDSLEDACVKEVDTQGNLVWSWFAKDHLDTTNYASIYRNGWTHTNAVTRMDNNNTLISPRNFNRTIEVNPQGNIIWEIDWEDLYPTAHPFKSDPHDPEIHTDNSLLCCLQWDTPFQAVEINRTTKQPVWEYARTNFRTCRDADRLPNGNRLLVGVMDDIDESVIFEVTPEKEIVWQLRLYKTSVIGSPGYFFKAQRICQ
jgi:hypothetical protein